MKNKANFHPHLNKVLKGGFSFFSRRNRAFYMTLGTNKQTKKKNQPKPNNTQTGKKREKKNF